YFQYIDVRAIVVLGVRDGGLEQLADDRRALLRRIGEDVDRLVDRLAANKVGDQPSLLGREARAAQAGFGFHVDPYFFAAGAAAAGAAAGAAAPGAPAGGRRSPPTASSVRLPAAEWLLNMRVSANSPSLSPTMFSVPY